MSTYQVDNIQIMNNILDNNDPSKKLTLSLANVTSNTTRILTVPNANTTIVGTDTSQTLTNKTITDSTNNITANGLRTATSSVDIAAASAPTSGQVLTATSATEANWQTPAVYTINFNNNGTVSTANLSTIKQWYGRGTSTSGVVTFNVTTDGTSTGSAIFPTLSLTTHYLIATAQANSTSNTVVPFASIQNITNNRVVRVNVKTGSGSGLTNAANGTTVYLNIIGV